MKWELITPLITFLIVLLVQITLIPLIAIAGVIPDLVLISLVYYSISRNQFYGTLLGAYYGFLIDLITGSLLGINTYIFSLIVFICALIDSIIFSFFSAFDVQTNIFKLLFEQALLPSLYTAMVSIFFIFSPFRRRKF